MDVGAVMSVVLDYFGNPRPPYRGELVRPVVSAACWACGGTGWNDTGLHEGTNVSFGNVCVHCAGRGTICREIEPEAA